MRTVKVRILPPQPEFPLRMLVSMARSVLRPFALPFCSRHSRSRTQNEPTQFGEGSVIPSPSGRDALLYSCCRQNSGLLPYVITSPVTRNRAGYPECNYFKSAIPTVPTRDPLDTYGTPGRPAHPQNPPKCFVPATFSKTFVGHQTAHLYRVHQSRSPQKPFPGE
jgi:hypothetical protein